MRKCVVCGTEYEYCPTCYRDKFKPKYMLTIHSENCKGIWDVMSAYATKQLTKEEAKEFLAELDVKVAQKFNPVVAQYIKEING
ncbi:MAG: hypothetical protein MJZ16_08000 [Bacteroidales bacterium]|nr:hypothetical protein [Bacteroidales bacterium]